MFVAIAFCYSKVNRFAHGVPCIGVCTGVCVIVCMCVFGMIHGNIHHINCNVSRKKPRALVGS
jgi:hypothetical protein